MGIVSDKRETLEKEEEFHMVVIALDLGNFKSFPCFIADFDESTRLGGEVHDLLPPRLPDGIPVSYTHLSLLFAGKISVCPQVFIHHRIHRKSSVSNSREKNPDAPYQAFQMVKSILESRNLMPQFQRSFLNWACLLYTSRCV